MNEYRIGFIGAGNMSQALIAGLVDSASVSTEHLSAVDPVPTALKGLKERGILTGMELPLAVQERDFIFLGVKPQVADSVLPALANTLVPGQVVVSMMAGVQTASIEQYVGHDTPVVRVMPQTLVRLRMGACAMCGGCAATPEHISQVRQILELVGSAVEVNEAQMDAVTGLSGSGPAYIYAVVDALADGGVCAGLPRNTALQLAAQTVAGAAQMILRGEHHPAELKEQVTSPGGTTIAGLHALELGGLRATLMNAVLEASKRSRELGSP